MTAEDARIHASRRTVSSENAGTHTAMYSAPSGVEYRTHSPLCAMTACPAWTSRVPSSCFTRTKPLSTIVNSSNSGLCPGSSHPSGLRICATLAFCVLLFTRPMYSSINFGFVPAALILVGCEIRVGIVASSLTEDRQYSECNEQGSRHSFPMRERAGSPLLSAQVLPSFFDLILISATEPATCPELFRGSPRSLLFPSRCLQ